MDMMSDDGDEAGEMMCENGATNYNYSPCLSTTLHVYIYIHINWCYMYIIGIGIRNYMELYIKNYS